MNVSFIWCKDFRRTFFRFIAIHAFVRPTDGQTDGNLVDNTALHSMQRGKYWDRYTHCCTNKKREQLGLTVLLVPCTVRRNSAEGGCLSYKGRQRCSGDGQPPCDITGSTERSFPRRKAGLTRRKAWKSPETAAAEVGMALPGYRVNWVTSSASSSVDRRADDMDSCQLAPVHTVL